MADAFAFTFSSSERLSPRAFLDAGGEDWTTLVEAARHLLAEMATGAVLEIRSLQPSTRLDIPDWCASAGHELCWVPENGIATRYWVRKGTALVE